MALLQRHAVLHASPDEKVRQMTPFYSFVPGMAAALLLAMPSTGSAQQAYPSKPIRLIVPFPPGGSVDPIARMIGQKLADSLGQQVIVDNRPGSNGTIGTELLAKAPPDGHTLIHLGASTHAVNAVLMRKLPYDSVKDFAPVATVQRSNYVLVVHPSLPAGDLRQLIALARARPGQIAYASSGNGNLNHLAAELFNMMTGVATHHVPYKGGGPALLDVVRGEVQMHFSVVISAIPHVQSGRLKPLAIGGEQRFAMLPKVPTFTEAGLPGFDLRPWQGMLAPAGTPRPIVDRLSGEVGRIVSMPDVRDKLLQLGMEPLVSTPEQFAALLQADMAKAAKVAKVANIRLE
jgi:tripartite-type tricarboxylate transporter receptor subunit TctC